MTAKRLTEARSGSVCDQGSRGNSRRGVEADPRIGFMIDFNVNCLVVFAARSNNG